MPVTDQVIGELNVLALAAWQEVIVYSPAMQFNSA